MNTDPSVSNHAYNFTARAPFNAIWSLERNRIGECCHIKTNPTVFTTDEFGLSQNACCKSPRQSAELAGTTDSRGSSVHHHRMASVGRSCPEAAFFATAVQSSAVSHRAGHCIPPGRLVASNRCLRSCLVRQQRHCYLCSSHVPQHIRHSSYECHPHRPWNMSSRGRHYNTVSCREWYCILCGEVRLGQCHTSRLPHWCCSLRRGRTGLPLFGLLCRYAMLEPHDQGFGSERARQTRTTLLRILGLGFFPFYNPKSPASTSRMADDNALSGFYLIPPLVLQGSGMGQPLQFKQLVARSF